MGDTMVLGQALFVHQHPLGRAHLRGRDDTAPIRRREPCAGGSFPQVLVAAMVAPAAAQRRQAPPRPSGPWMERTLSPDRRADLVIEQMTLDEKIGLVHGAGFIGFGPPPKDPRRGAGPGTRERRRRLRARHPAARHPGPEHGRLGGRRARAARCASRYSTRAALRHRARRKLGHRPGATTTARSSAASCATRATTSPSAAAWTSPASRATAATSSTRARTRCWPGASPGHLMKRHPEPEGHRRPQALRGERPGDRPQRRSRQPGPPLAPRDRPPRLRDRPRDLGRGHGDGRLQPRQRRLLPARTATC